MTTTAKTAAADTILAIDLGKYKSVAWVHDQPWQCVPGRPAQAGVFGKARRAGRGRAAAVHVAGRPRPLVAAT
jgi:hypothetical protein